MKSFLYLLIVVLSFSSNTFCVNLGIPQGVGPSGYFYSHYTIGYSENVKPETASKIGRSCVNRYAFFYSSGDASIEAAALAGGITEIKTKNKEAYNYFLLYSSLCTIVTGN
jgi:hypothetical protein